tara:strand:- start:249 stop:1004 length:756 start_codon:yes stop_codon:yes gene_type:complete
MNSEDYYPILSQSSPNDRRVLLKLQDFIKEIYPTYNYVEIGSFMGGSLTPYLMDDSCLEVLSIDDRERQQPDERGACYDYATITSQTMLDNIVSKGLSIDKIKIFDGDVKVFVKTDYDKEKKYHVAFIDGEHTDFACFSDFVNIRKLLESNSIVAFHDSNLVFKSLRNIRSLLESEGVKFKFIKVVDSEMTVILFGDVCDIDLSSLISDSEDWMVNAETELLASVFKHRLSHNSTQDIEFTINPPPVHKAF